MEHRDISRWLNDDIAQMLLGIGVRLAAMQREAKVDADELIDGLATTSQQAERSVRSAQRIADRGGKQP